MPIEKNISIIRFLKVIKDSGLIFYDGKNVIPSISPAKVFLYSSEAAYDYFCLVEDDLMNDKRIREGFKWIYVNKKQDLSVKFYNKLCDVFYEEGDS